MVASARKSIVIQAELERLREMSNREAKTTNLVEDLSLGFSKSAYVLEEEKEMAKLLSQQRQQVNNTQKPRIS